MLLEEGPSTYSIGDLRDGTRLAQKIVSAYGMTDAGITMYAPKQRRIAFMKRAFEVRVVLPLMPALRQVRLSGAFLQSCFCRSLHHPAQRPSSAFEVRHFVCPVYSLASKACASAIPRCSWRPLLFSF